MVRKEKKMTKKTCKEDISPTIYKVREIAKQDAQKLHEAEQSYGDSWKKRGGVGAFLMLARKWDRLEKQVNEHEFNIFKASIKDKRDEGIIDDIRDLRRYLLLVEAEITEDDDKPNYDDEKFLLNQTDEWKTR
jgi:hypothetical protein